MLGSNSTIAVLSELFVIEITGVLIGAVCVQTPKAPGFASNNI